MPITAHSFVSERVKAGMAQGKRCSRPPISEEIQAEIARLYRKKVSINQISQRLNIAYGTAWNYVKALEQTDKQGS